MEYFCACEDKRLVSMKIKMPCKLCEIDRQHKFLGAGCTHSDYVLPQMPTVVPLGLGLQLQDPAILVPQLRDMMLAAYLFRGYYQPAGPLISVPHSHGQPLGKAVPLSEPSPTASPPVQQPPPPPSSAGDSSDSEVIITSVTSAKEAAAAAAQQQAAPHAQQYRYYPPAHAGYPYGYPPQYYSAPPLQAYGHHELCYPPYSPAKHVFRRYMAPPPAQYYRPGSPEVYGPPHPGPHPGNSGTQVATATSTSSASSGGGYTTGGSASSPAGPASQGPPPPTIIDTYPQPPPTLMESFPPPPPAHFYGYGHGHAPPPPPPCYTHSPPSRTLNYINTTYQGCPCPIQSCPKNVHTGPLTGDSKRSNISIAKESVPLPPVALALPLEPASATGPPSPARGSAGMPPPPSPAGATYQQAPPKQESPEPPDLTNPKKRARVGKAMVRNTMLLMCHDPDKDNYLENAKNVKREVESPKENEKKGIEVIVERVEVEVQAEALKKEDDVVSKTVEDEVKNLPCVNTVAENVKVKNMKRKSSVATPEPEQPSAKKAKNEKSNGSYKDLIKKTESPFKINNGKQKLIGEKALRLKLKRKLSVDASATLKKNKNTKPLTASNLHNSKQNKNTSKKDTSAERTTTDSVCASVRTTKVQQEEEKQQTSNKKEQKVKKSIGRPPKVKSKSATAKRKNSKCKEVAQVVSRVPRRSVQLRWSNGWTWAGEPFDGKVFLNSDETIVIRKCYPAMRHEEGDLIEPRDCVLLKAGQRKNELPFVAKIASLWENPDDGEMMMSLLWYYRPEHTEQGRILSDQPDEVFASRHKDSNSVACIEDKCFVLTFNEYCRYRKNLRRLEEGIEDAGPCIPSPDIYPRTHRQPPKSLFTSPDMVFFCRRVYDFRQKRIVKNPS